MRRFIALLAAGLLLLALVPSVAAKQPFAIDSYSTSYDHSTSTITWTIRFTAKPDFQTADEFNRQANSFQILVPDEEVVRGEEIHCVGDIPIRRVSPAVDEPCSGGWGRVVTEVPYTAARQDADVRHVQPLVPPVPVRLHHRVVRVRRDDLPRHGDRLPAVVTMSGRAASPPQVVRPGAYRRLSVSGGKCGVSGEG